MVFTKEQAELNGKAVAAFLQGKPIQWQDFGGGWHPTTNIKDITEIHHRPAPEPPPPERWSRMDHVPLNAWLRRKDNTELVSIDTIMSHGIRLYARVVWWDEIENYLYTTGERDASGSFIFRECLVLP